jgi:hypothetical protein
VSTTTHTTSEANHKAKPNILEGTATRPTVQPQDQRCGRVCLGSDKPVMQKSAIHLVNLEIAAVLRSGGHAVTGQRRDQILRHRSIRQGTSQCKQHRQQQATVHGNSGVDGRSWAMPVFVMIQSDSCNLLWRIRGPHCLWPSRSFVLFFYFLSFSHSMCWSSHFIFAVCRSSAGHMACLLPVLCASSDQRLCGSSS